MAIQKVVDASAEGAEKTFLRPPREYGDPAGPFQHPLDTRLSGGQRTGKDEIGDLGGCRTWSAESLLGLCETFCKLPV